MGPTTRQETTPETIQFPPPAPPLESEDNLPPTPPPISSPLIEDTNLESQPPSPLPEYLDEEDPSPPLEDFQTSDPGEEGEDLDIPGTPPGAERDPDSDEDESSFLLDLDVEVPPITREDMLLNQRFVQMLRNATLGSQFTPKELDDFLNPQELDFSPSEDPDLLLSISNYVDTLNASQDVYAKTRLNFQRRSPEVKMLSYDQVKRRVSRLSGVVTWQDDMCIDSCVGFTGPYKDLEECPRCHKPRYDPDKLAKSNGKTKIPQKSFTTFPVGPQLQAHWRSPRSAEKMHYRRKKTKDILRDRDLDTGEPVWDDIMSGSDYLESVESGTIKDEDVVLMLSIDGAQLLRNKKSDAWIYIWILLDLGPDKRYKIRNIIPGGIIPGPGKPGDLDSFLFPGLAHVSALQKSGLPLWDAYLGRRVISFLFLLLVLADAVAMAELTASVGHHGRRGCRLLCDFVG